MLLTSVTVTNSRGETLTFTLADISGGFAVQSIEGLGPVKATLVSSSFANQDGEQYHSSRREARNIVFKLGLEPDYAIASVQQLRSQLYNFFMTKTKAKLTFHMFNKFEIVNNTLDVDIEARVESCEPDIFTKDPVMDISLMCFDPDFVDLNLVTFDGMSVADTTDSLISYPGTVETGAIFKLMADRSIPEFTIYHKPSDDILRTIDFTVPLVADDILTINSNLGSKGIVLTRGGVDTSVLYGKTPQSGWVELEPGDNNFRVYIPGAAVPYSLEYFHKYGGL